MKKLNPKLNKHHHPDVVSNSAYFKYLLHRDPTKYPWQSDRHKFKQNYRMLLKVRIKYKVHSRDACRRTLTAHKKAIWDADSPNTLHTLWESRYQTFKCTRSNPCKN